jgi:hypothetical protein
VGIVAIARRRHTILTWPAVCGTSALSALSPGTGKEGDRGKDGLGWVVPGHPNCSATRVYCAARGRYAGVWVGSTEPVSVALFVCSLLLVRRDHHITSPNPTHLHDCSCPYQRCV